MYVVKLIDKSMYLDLIIIINELCHRQDAVDKKWVRLAHATVGLAVPHLKVRRLRLTLTVPKFCSHSAQQMSHG